MTTGGVRSVGKAELALGRIRGKACACVWGGEAVAGGESVRSCSDRGLCTVAEDARAVAGIR